MNKEFWKAAGIRALKTFCQSILAMVAVGVTFTDVDWITVLSTSGVAAVLSVLTSVATGLPEVKEK